jgi:membrane protease YdiL (CAAX protease family)
MIPQDTEQLQSTKNHAVFVIVVLLVYAIPVVFVVISAFTSLDNNLVWKNLSGILAGAVMMGIALWGLQKEKIPFESIGLSPSLIKEALILAVVGWSIVVLGRYLIIVMNHASISELFGKPALYILRYWFFVGIAEELLFRGYILIRLMNAWRTRNQRLGQIMAIVLTSLLFATAHIPQRVHQVFKGELTHRMVFTSIVLLTIVGIVYSYFFLRTRNILLVGLIHGGVIVPLVGASEDTFLPVVIVAAI